MALVHRKRINSTLTENNYNYIVDLKNKTGLDQSKLFDLAVSILKVQLETNDLLYLINQYSSNDEK